MCKFQFLFQLVHWIELSSIEHSYACLYSCAVAEKISTDRALPCQWDIYPTPVLCTAVHCSTYALLLTHILFAVAKFLVLTGAIF